MREIIENKTFDMERALYDSNGLLVKNCRFDGPADGESALKESRDVELENCFFNLRYPFWHDDNVKITDAKMTEMCRAAIWYSRNMEIAHSKLHGIKALRECAHIKMRGCDVISPEFGWSVHGMHYQVAEDHGFTDIADFQILDENGSMNLPVTGGTRLTENYVGAAFADYDSYLVLSHFKGHAMAGFGGAIKNISIGLGSSEGKCWIHSGGTSMTNAWGGEQDAFLESMAEAGKSVSDYLGSGERIVYINVMNRLSVDCDCNGNPAEPDMHDIGILASTDPVALDQACIDLVYSAEDSESLVERIESRNGLHTLEHAAEIGLGSREYRLVDISVYI